MINGVVKNEWKILESILKKYTDIFTFSFFGSRVSGQYRSSSDLDLCVRQKSSVDIKQVSLAKAGLENELENSSLTFKVDIVSFEYCSADFQKVIIKNEVFFN